MTGTHSRRDFLKKVALSFGASLFWHTDLNRAARAGTSYKIASWKGDDFTVGHHIRDAKLPRLPSKTSKKVDFVIVGGGLAGLSAAHYLKDESFLLLEQYDSTGGHARGDSFRGIDYSFGSQYFTDMEGDLGELVHELDLKPVKMETGESKWYWDGSLTGSEAGTAPGKELARLKEEVKKYSGMFSSNILADYRKHAELKKLDGSTLHSALASYDPKFLALLNSYCKSSLCGGIKQVSALAGLSLLDDLNLPTYEFEGGNPALSRALAESVKKNQPDSVVTDAFVWSIEATDRGVSVVYGSGSKRTRVECKHVIVAIPHMISSRILHGVDDKLKASLFGFRYGSYLVANLLMRKRVFDGPFDSWFAPPLDFADITVAETPYMMTGNYKEEMGSVLTVYQPYEAASIGRVLLFKGDREALSSKMMDQLSKVAPEVRGALEEIVLARWGHALAVPRPGYFDLVDSLTALSPDSISFAHSSALGLPCAEAAVSAARQAVARARKKRVIS
ncbi:MAG: FAD-dependent oxidoreductase [Cyanobacteria bacterium HKST-UBA02]|nr:FAD-dependent oxidoreductase [Cyanobacteria bacterium HKST-UBA02]